MSAVKYTPMEQIPGLVAETRTAFSSFVTRPLEFRKQQLMQLYKMFNENEEKFCDALYKDLRKPKSEAMLSEIVTLKNEALEAIESLDEWAKLAYPSVPAVNAMDGCRVIKEPLGTVLIIGAWNYPVQLLLAPFIGAVAAGCTAVLKPSEVSPHSAQIMADLLPKYLDQKCYKIINGAVAETSALLEQKWDHIFYTGSGNVGKIIMAAAARQLCSVTLELGGKSPVVVDSNCDFAVTAARIAWGRWGMNAGQTCIAPDYVLALPGVQDVLVKHLKQAVAKMFGENVQKSSDYTRIVNKNHFNRLKRLLGAGEVAFGGQTDEEDLFIHPTTLVNVPLDAPVMKEEIFGPILPIVTVKSVDEAIAFINSRDKPLALYSFSRNPSFNELVAQRTSSGGFLANDTIMHFTVPALPFGGVGPSGLGRYHGKASFDTFSHEKSSMFKKQTMEFVNSLRSPPYSPDKLKWITMLLGKKPSSLPHLPWKQLFIVLTVALIAARISVTNPGFVDGLKAFFGL